MKWFECVEDLGDGTTAVRRFKTKEGAEMWISTRDSLEEDTTDEFGCYPYGDLEEVDTDSNWFWDD